MKVIIPKIGDSRIKKGFLLAPKVIGNESRWMEYAEWTQEFSKTSGSEKWTDHHWNKTGN
jgi:hypothetical protein